MNLIKRFYLIKYFNKCKKEAKEKHYKDRLELFTKIFGKKEALKMIDKKN